MRIFTAALLGLALLTAAGCSNGDDGLRSGNAQAGPDEFSILPARPLELPDGLALPEPTPGGSNLTDPIPNIDAILALGGRPSAQSGNIPARDSALVAQTSRYGTDPQIRATLAEEDAAFRRRVERVSGRAAGRYFRAYARFALDAYAELARYQALGVAVPTAPPPE
ncbi:MAG: DUF3035 domain-containing protein [Rhodobacteraceae bacterium]|nr:DUF3035 domain-containing protein [Paracoccaceae bacterium]